MEKKKKKNHLCLCRTRWFIIIRTMTRSQSTFIVVSKHKGFKSPLFYIYFIKWSFEDEPRSVKAWGAKLDALWMGAGDASGPSSPWALAPGSRIFTIPKFLYCDNFQVNIHYPAKKVFIHTFPAWEVTCVQVKVKLPVFTYSKSGLWVNVAHFCISNLVLYSRDMLELVKDIFFLITNIVLMTEEAQSELHNFLN